MSEMDLYLDTTTAQFENLRKLEHHRGFKYHLAHVEKIELNLDN